MSNLHVSGPFADTAIKMCCWLAVLIETNVGCKIMDDMSTKRSINVDLCHR